MKKVTLIYLSSYLLAGGIGFAFVPDAALKIFMSTGDYGDIMPRMVGMFMIVLGFLITQFIKNKDYKYYLPTIIARTFIVIFLSALYFQTSDPLFIIVNIIVLIGLIPSIYVYFKGKA
jgi:uncharacterized protein YjeT (DUF2065 family)